MDIKLSHSCGLRLPDKSPRHLRRSEPVSGGENSQMPSQLSKAYDAAGAGVHKVSWNAKEPASSRPQGWECSLFCLMKQDGSIRKEGSGNTKPVAAFHSQILLRSRSVVCIHTAQYCDTLAVV